MNTFKTHLIESRMEKRKAAVVKARDYLESVAKELAPDYDTFEQFSNHVAKLVPQLEFGPGGTVILQHDTGPIHMDLKWMWKHYNPSEQRKFRNSWDSYGEARARSKDRWTGD